MNAPMLLPFFSLCAGILLESTGMGMWSGVIIIICGSIIYIWLSNVKSNPVSNFRYAPFHYFWIAFYFLGIGILLGSISRPDCPVHSEINNSIVAKGKIEKIKNSTFGDRLTVQIYSLYDEKGSKKTWNNLNMLIYSDAVPSAIGDIIVFPINDLKRIKDSENSFQTGYAENLAKKGIFYSAQTSGKNIRIIGKEFSISAFSTEIRDSFVSFIEKQSLKKETKNFIITLLAGDKDYLDNETHDLFSDAGIAHVLALSGMHIGFISGIFLFILFPLNFIGRYKLRYFLTAILLWAYAFLTGMSPSILRACVMATAFILSILLERKNTALNSLCLAGFIILLFSPNALYDIGFQLSFLCVASLILFADSLNPIDRRRHKRIYSFFALILASIITTFSSWIVVAYYFHRFPTMFLPTNILVLPFLPFYITLILIYLICNGIGIELNFIGLLIDKCYILFKNIIDHLGHNSSVTIDVPVLSVVLWLIGILALSFFIIKKKNFWGIIISGIFFISSLGTAFFSPNKNIEKGILICNSYPNVEIKYSDGSEEKNIKIPLNAISIHDLNGKKICVLDYHQIPSKLSRNYSKIDYLIVTGRFKGSINDINKIFKPDKIITHSSIRKKREKDLLNEASEHSIPSHSLRNNKALKILD